MTRSLCHYLRQNIQSYHPITMKLTPEQKQIIEAKRLLSIELRKQYMKEYNREYYRKNKKSVQTSSDI